MLFRSLKGPKLVEGKSRFSKSTEFLPSFGGSRILPEKSIHRSMDLLTSDSSQDEERERKKSFEDYRRSFDGTLLCFPFFFFSFFFFSFLLFNNIIQRKSN